MVKGGGRAMPFSVTYDDRAGAPGVNPTLFDGTFTPD